MSDQGTNIEGDFFQGDQHIHGDQVGQDKIERDKITIGKVENNYYHTADGKKIPYTAPAPTTTGAEYVERKLTADIRKALCNREQTGITGGQVGVAGMGGVGKSELAKRLALELAPSFPGGVYWVSFGVTADHKAQPIENVMRDLLRQLAVQPPAEADPGTLAKAAWVKLGVSDAACLLIYDDLRPGHAPHLKDVLPPAACALLITTRIQRLGAVKLHSLDLFTPEEAAEAMRGVLGAETCDAEKAELEQVMARCGYLALAINVAARNIEVERDEYGEDRPVAAYLRRLDDRLAALEIEHPEEKAVTSVRAVLATSYYALDGKMQRRFDQLGIFAGDDFPRWAVGEIWRTADEDTVKKRLGLLVRRSMLQTVGGGRYKLHDLWRDFARAQLAAGEVEADTRRAHTGAYAGYVDQHDDWEGVPLLNREYADLAAAVNWAEGAGDTDLLYWLAWHTHRLMDTSGRWTEGEGWLRAALAAIGEPEEDEAKKRQSNLLFALGNLAYNKGDYQEAERVNRESLVLDTTLGDKRGMAVMQGKLAELAMRRGNYDEAERLQRQANAVYEELGNRHSAAVGQAILAELAIRRGDYDEAERLYRKSLRVRKRISVQIE